MTEYHWDGLFGGGSMYTGADYGPYTITYSTTTPEYEPASQPPLLYLAIGMAVGFCAAAVAVVGWLGWKYREAVR